MTNRANHAAFKSKTLGLIDTLKLTDTEVVGLALTLAAAFGRSLSPSQLRTMLDDAVERARVSSDIGGAQ